MTITSKSNDHQSADQTLSFQIESLAAMNRHFVVVCLVKRFFSFYEGTQNFFKLSVDLSDLQNFFLNEVMLQRSVACGEYISIVICKGIAIDTNDYKKKYRFQLQREFDGKNGSNLLEKSIKYYIIGIWNRA